MRFGAGIVELGPANSRPPKDTAEAEAQNAPAEREALLAWSAESAAVLLNALRAAGPDTACWTWWDTSQSPQTSGAVARHQVQEATVHTYDAQLTGSAAQPLPAEVALDGVEEFLTTCVATTDPWPYEPAVLDFHATEGRSWRVALAADGVRTTRVAPDEPAPADGARFAAMRATAGELVLMLYSRIPMDALNPEGEKEAFHQLRDWDPDA